jgi:hypothetical protein
VRQHGEQREEQPADDGGGDVQVVEPPDSLPQLDADEVDDGAQRERLQQVELEGAHRVVEWWPGVVG